MRRMMGKKQKRGIGMIWRTIALWGLLLLPTVGLAQTTPPTDPDTQPESATPAPQGAGAPSAEAVRTAPVTVDGRALFEVRGSSVVSAPERARRVSERIVEVARRTDSHLVTVSVRPTEFGLAIYADGTLITVATEAEAALEQMSQEVVANLHAEAVREAIVEYRQARGRDARVDTLIEVALWTGAFVLITLAYFFARRRISDRLAGFVQRQLAGVDAATNKAVRAQAIGALVGYGTRLFLLLILVLALYYYLTLVMLAFAETRSLAQLLLTYVTEPILNILLGFVRYIPNFITLIIIALLARYIIKGVRIYFDGLETGTFDLGNFEPHWIRPTFNIVRFVLILIAVVFAFPYIPGSDSAAFQGLTILIGAMLSLGSNSVVSNVLSGVFVLYRRSTNLGDRIKVGEHVGDVVEIKLMETHIKSIKNELVSIPNAQLLSSDVVNYTKKVDGSGLLLHTTVGIGYEEPPEKIEAMLIEAAKRTQSLKNRPEPFVLWTALGDFAISYQINAYTTRGAFIPKIKSDLHRNIVSVFNENRVQIMTPNYEADPDAPKLPPAEPWDGVLAHQTSGSD